MDDPAPRLTASVWNALGGDSVEPGGLFFDVDGALPSTFAVTDLASTAIAAAALALAKWIEYHTDRWPRVCVDRRLASFWFRSSLRPDGWSLPGPWDPIAGDYASADGWIRLHTNAPHHRAAAEHVLGGRSDRPAIAAAVARWSSDELEAAIVDAGGCAAAMRTVALWRAHPHGRAVANEPLIEHVETEPAPQTASTFDAARPLAGIRVLDLTRVLAGPVASRFLAGYGAQVLRIDPPSWNEPGVVPEVTLGKRCARLDLTSNDDRDRFESLLKDADVMLHGYRAEALERLGYGDAVRRRLRPGLVDVRLNAYGWTGPWRDRRGFDSLVQMSAGIADAGMRWQKADHPVPLPAQALDHATGYLMAAAAVRGITARFATGRGTQAWLSLARTAKLLVDNGEVASLPSLADETGADREAAIEHTPWGNAQRLRPPASIDGAPMRWDLPASDLGSASPHWL